jgi:hypothetical protein
LLGHGLGQALLEQFADRGVAREAIEGVLELAAVTGQFIREKWNIHGTPEPWSPGRKQKSTHRNPNVCPATPEPVNQVVSRNCQSSPETTHDNPMGPDWNDARSAADLTSTVHEDVHAREIETSILLYAYPELVKEGYEAADWLSTTVGTCL